MIVIQASDLDSANDFCNELGAIGDTFQVPLFDSLDQLAGYWCGWNVTEEQYEQIKERFDWIFDTPDEALSTCGWYVQVDEL